MEDSVKQFIKDLRRDCRNAGIKLQLRPFCSVRIESGGPLVAGYFLDSKCLVIAKKDPNWIANLCHESSHMDQWLEDSELWKKGVLGSQSLQNWLYGHNIKNIRKIISNIIECELDCERRALKKIAQYDLPINTATYIQRANDNILHYRWVEKTRMWNNNISGTYSKMPTRFMSNSYYKKLSQKIERIYQEAA